MGKKFIHRIFSRAVPHSRSGRLERWFYEWLYWVKRTPWDTRITPPEVMQYLDNATPGRALDLGCGTGTNAITLAHHGWQVTGLDFARRAIQIARHRAQRAGLEIDFRTGDVSDLSGLTGVYAFALDIGCLHTIPNPTRPGYASQLAVRVRPGGTFMLYAWLPRTWRGKKVGLSTYQVRELFGQSFRLERHIIGKEKEFGSAWYWFTRLE